MNDLTVAARRLYGSAAWRAARWAALARAGFRCQRPGCRRDAREVHHVDEMRMDNRRRWLDQRNLQALCSECHKAEHVERGHAVWTRQAQIKADWQAKLRQRYQSKQPPREGQIS